MPSYKKFGSGPCKILAIHGWFSDGSSFEPLLPYLDPGSVTVLFLDLRGYGVAKEFRGEYSLNEAVRDACNLVQAETWKQFHLLADAMGCLIAHTLIQEHTPRIKSFTALAPVPPSGAPKSPELLRFLEKATMSCDVSAFECIHALGNRRYSPYVVDNMIRKWKTSSTPEARLSYLDMVCNSDLTGKMQPKHLPVLSIFGEHDIEDSRASFDKDLQKWYPEMQFFVCKEAGHFLIQETPLQIASRLSEFVTKIPL